MPVNISTPGALGGTPAVVLGTAAAAGVASTFLRTDDTLIAFDTTAPVTQASADVAAAGSAAVAARRDHKHGMPTISSGAVAREGGNLAEGTTTSSSNVNLLTASSLSLETGIAGYGVAQIRKTTGAAAGGFTGVTLNATLVKTTTAVWSGTTNAAEPGFWETKFQGALTDYTGGGHEITHAQSAVVLDTAYIQDNVPVATITSVILVAKVGNTLVTMGADELNVYSYVNA